MGLANEHVKDHVARSIHQVAPHWSTAVAAIRVYVYAMMLANATDGTW